MPNKTKKLKEIYEKLSTPEEKILDMLENIDHAKLRGDKGEDGQNGSDGKDGKDGKDGRDGRDGKDGRDGEDGKDGENGKDGNVITPKETRDKLKELKGIERLSVYDLKDTEWLKGEKGQIQWSSAGFKIYTDSTLTGDGTYANPLHAVGGGGSFPQLTQAQINALTPINGQTAYNTTIDSPQIYIAGAWYSLQVAQQ